MCRKSYMETDEKCELAEGMRNLNTLARHLLSHSLFDLGFRSLFVFRITDVIF